MSAPLLVGESNPYGSDPRFALFPDPPGCAGHRLYHDILGLSRPEYMRRFRRVNLCGSVWTLREARRYASELLAGDSGPLILLGRKVARAFGYGDADLLTRFNTLISRPDGALCDVSITVLPHPSGRNRVWNDSLAVQRARALLSEFLQPPVGRER